MKLESELINFFEQWEQLSLALLQQGVFYISASTQVQLKHWQQQAGLLGFQKVEQLCSVILTQNENMRPAQAFGQLLYLMDALHKSAIAMLHRQVSSECESC